MSSWTLKGGYPYGYPEPKYRGLPARMRAKRQILRHRMETYAEPFPDGSMYIQPIGVENMLRGMESLRASLEKWPVPDLSPLFQSQTLPPAHDLMGCTGAWTSHINGLRKCADCGTEMSSVIPRPEPRVVGYRSKLEDGILRCLDHPPYGEYIPVASEELENGGICTWCGNDVLAHPGVNQ